MSSGRDILREEDEREEAVGAETAELLHRATAGRMTARQLQALAGTRVPESSRQHLEQEDDADV